MKILIETRIIENHYVLEYISVTDFRRQVSVYNKLFTAKGSAFE